MLDRLKNFLNRTESADSFRLFRIIWMILIVSASVIALIATGRCVSDLYRYMRVSKPLVCNVSKWEVVERRQGEYLIKAYYEYRYNNKYFSAEQTFSRPVFTNPYIANHTLEEYKNSRWPVWIAPKKPHIAVIQREFSINRIVQAMLSLGLLIYFVWLRGYIESMFRTDRPT